MYMFLRNVFIIVVIFISNIQFAHSKIYLNKKSTNFIHSKRNINLKFLYLKENKTLEIFFKNKSIALIYLTSVFSLNEINQILSDLGIEDVDLSFLDIYGSEDTNCNLQSIIMQEDSSLKNLEKSVSKVRVRLIKETLPDVKNTKGINIVGSFFKSIFNISTFLPRKIFEHVFVSGAWSVMSEEDKKKLIAGAIIDAIKGNGTLLNELAPEYKECISRRENNCSQYLSEINILVQDFVDQHIDEIRSFSYEKKEKLSKKVRVALMSAIALKHIKESSFLKGRPLLNSEKEYLNTSLFNVIKGYRQCLNITKNEFETNSCDHKISISAPFHIGKEILKIKLKQNISCKVGEREYQKLLLNAQAEYDACAEKNYFTPTDRGVNINDSSSIMKSCVFSGVLTSVRNIAKSKVDRAVKEQLKDKNISFPKNIKFAGKKEIDHCFKKEGLLKKRGSKYNYNRLEKVSASDFKRKIDKCSSSLTVETGRKIGRLIVKNNKNFSNSFTSKEKKRALNKVVNKGYNYCMNLYSNKDPSVCSGMMELEATRVAIEKNLMKNTLNNLKGRKKHQIANRIVAPALKTFNSCMDETKQKMVDNIILIEIYKIRDPNCLKQENLLCYEEMKFEPRCQNYQTSYEEGASSECLKKSLIPLSYHLSGHIIKKKAAKNKDLRELGFSLKKSDILENQKITKQCFKKLIHCSSDELKRYSKSKLKNINCSKKIETLDDIVNKSDMISSKCEGEVNKNILGMIVNKELTSEIDNTLMDSGLADEMRELDFLEKRENENDKNKIKELKLKILKRKNKLKKQKERLKNQLLSQLFENIEKEDKLSKMLKHVERLKANATYNIMNAVVDDKLNTYLPKKSGNLSHLKLRKKIKNEIVGIKLKEALNKTSGERERSGLIEDIKVKVTEAISNQVIQDNINLETPSTISISYKRNITSNLQNAFKKCLNNDSKQSDYCTNFITRSATSKLYYAILSETAKDYISRVEEKSWHDIKGVFTDLSTKLDRVKVKRMITKNNKKVVDCLSEIGLNEDTSEFTQKTKGCTALGILDFSTKITSSFLKKYKSILQDDDVIRIKKEYRDCVNDIKVEAVNKSFKNISYSKNAVKRAFSVNPQLNSNWVTEKVSKCSEDFSNNIPASLLNNALDVIDIFNIND